MYQAGLNNRRTAYRASKSGHEEPLTAGQTTKRAFMRRTTHPPPKKPIIRGTTDYRFDHPWLLSEYVETRKDRAMAGRLKNRGFRVLLGTYLLVSIWLHTLLDVIPRSTCELSVKHHLFTRAQALECGLFYRDRCAVSNMWFVFHG